MQTTIFSFCHVYEPKYYLQLWPKCHSACHIIPFSAKKLQRTDSCYSSGDVCESIAVLLTSQVYTFLL